jgi:hypothetical protein
MLKIDRKAAIDHLTSIGYSTGDTVYLRAIPGKGHTGAIRKGKGIFPELPWDSLDTFQTEGKGIYFVANGQGDTDDEVKTCSLLFFEHDDLDKTAQESIWQTLGLPEPTAQVETRKSIHSYWLLETPIDADEWRTVQANLLDYAQADRSLKNPSRVMRLAGSWHVKADKEPMLCRIISASGKRSFLPDIAELVRPDEQLYEPIKAANDPGAIPLSACLTKDDRALIASGLSEGGRNHAGAKLARNLIATQKYLQIVQHKFTEFDRGLFDEFCSRCNPPLDRREADAIWASACKANSKPSLTAEAIENCVKAYHKRQSTPGSAVESDLPQSDDDWTNFRNGIHKLVESVPDQFERSFRLRQICGSYKMPISLGTDIIEAYRGKVKTFEPIDIVDFMAKKQGDREWLVAGHIPLGAVINLCAMGGSGKTSLAYEWGKSVTLGAPWNGFPVKEGNVLFIQSDEPEGDAQEKLDIQNFYEMPRERCFIYFNWLPAGGGMEQLEDYIKANEIRFIVIDSLAAINLGMDRDRSEFADNLRVLKDIANSQKCTFLVLDHTNKSGGNLGTIAVHNAVSEMMYLKFPTDDERRQYLADESKDYRILSWEKSRSGMKGIQFVLRQNPVDYTNEHLGELSHVLSDGDRTFEMFNFINMRSAELSVKEFADKFGLNFDEALAKLESMRRVGMIGGTWVVPKKGEHTGKRWRVYHSIHKVELPPEEPDEVVVEYEWSESTESADAEDF